MGCGGVLCLWLHCSAQLCAIFTAVDHGGCTFQLVEENGVGDGKSDFLSFSPEMVAEQFTLMDAVSTHSALGQCCCSGHKPLCFLAPHSIFSQRDPSRPFIFQELFKKVVPYHCLGCIWSQRDKKGKEHLAPTIRATVSQFNSVANCVIATCLGDRTLKPQQRAKVVERWIEVARVGRCSPTRLAQGWGSVVHRSQQIPWLCLTSSPAVPLSAPQECRILKNFSSLRAILSALQCNAVHRLKKTWDEVLR